MNKCLSILVLYSCIFFCIKINAQTLKVESFKQSTSDLSASTNVKLDNNGDACGLVKVQIAATGVTFEGMIKDKPEYGSSEYKVYMPKTSKKLTIKKEGCLPLTVNFPDYGIKGVESKMTYIMVVSLPKLAPAEVKKQKLTIKYSPSDAIILIDGEIREDISNGYATIELPVGEHNYNATAKGYNSDNGPILLTETAPKKLTIELDRKDGVNTSTIATQTVERKVQTQPVQQATQKIETTSRKVAYSATIDDISGMTNIRSQANGKSSIAMKLKAYTDYELGLSYIQNNWWRIETIYNITEGYSVKLHGSTTGYWIHNSIISVRKK